MALSDLSAWSGWIIVFSWIICVCTVSTDGSSSSMQAPGRAPRITEQPADVVVRKHEPVTLSCGADGDPPPRITWFHEGRPVKNSATRMPLPDGQLFFLHVLHGRRDQDTGIYWCVASNGHGEARSRNASLEVAVLREEFRSVPKSVRVAAGETATLECVPPKGYPEPQVRWIKDGQPLATTTVNSGGGGGGRLRVVGHGALVIADVRRSDQGRYVCAASNLVGNRESPPATLSVHVKPYFVRVPEDVTSLAEEDIEFQCKVSGDPQPSVTWRRQDGKMPVGRAYVMEDKSLHIKKVVPSDEGTYICESENPVGSISSSATLTVHSRPTFQFTPQDQKVGLNGVAKFECVATGNPPPSVFWTREGNQVLMFPGKSHGRFSVSSTGTLTISGVRKEDRGYYICSALSVVGSTMAKGHLEVTAVADLPPPIIRLGPANQTLPVSTGAVLPCEVTGTPPPTVQWMFNSAPLHTSNPRFTVLPSGTLQINDLQILDSGMYTCTASSESGETSWTASLTVESLHNPNVNFHRSPDVTTFPGPPSKPVAINITETSITLSWRRNEKVGASSLKGYTIEYYSSDLQSGWVIGAHRVQSEMYTVHALRPDCRYIFLVRAENSHGLGPPSAVSDVFRTLGLSPHALPEYNLDEARAKLSTAVVILQDMRAVSSTAVKLTWKIQGNKDYIEGFYIRFRDMSGGSQKYNMVTVLNGGASSYVLTDLKRFTEYEFFLVPFYKSVEGPPSNSRSVQTLEDVPTAPPDRVRVQVVNITSARISWSPPPPQHQNGKLKGYKLYVSGNTSEFHSNMSTNSTVTSLTLTNLTVGGSYQVSVVAMTSVGGGPLSTPAVFRVDGPSSTSLSTPLHNIVKQSWFIALIGSLMFLTIAIFVLFLIRKRRIELKKAMTAIPVHKPDDLSNCFNSLTTRNGLSPHEALWINHSAWRPSDQSKDVLCETKLLNKVDCGSNDLNYSSVYAPLNCGMNASDYAEVDTHNMTTFYKKDLPSIPEPYATTTLVNAAVQKSYNGSVKDGRSSSSAEEGSRKSDKTYEMERRRSNEDGLTDHLLESDKLTSPTSDSGSYTTDEYGMPVKKGRQKFSRGSAGKGPLMNWSDLIPPPPDQPPSEAESTPGSVRGINSQHRQQKQKVAMGPSQTANLRGPPSQPMSITGASPRTSLNRSTPNGGTVPYSYANRGSQPRPQMRPQLPTPQGVQDQPHMDRGVQSSLPSLINEPRNVPPNLAVLESRMAPQHGHIYHPADVESDIDDPLRPRSPESIPSVAGETDYAPSHAPSWASTTEQSNSSCTSGRSSGASSYDDSVYNEVDFASAVARAAQNVGFQVNGSVVSGPPGMVNRSDQGTKRDNVPQWLMPTVNQHSDDRQLVDSQRSHCRIPGLCPPGDQPQNQVQSLFDRGQQQICANAPSSMQKKDSTVSSYNKPSFPVYQAPSNQSCASSGAGRRWRGSEEQAQPRHTNSMPSSHANKEQPTSRLRHDLSHVYHGST
ncbi:protein sax-3-like isoform X2 [Ornithodoros turicata]|uniref:protein sax-3-like isoform X2 n=1 Tax=Ornithodoros turicata TaxID=34597 RepID=UPI003138CE92